LLRMGRHGPTGHHDDEARDEVALGGPVPVLAQPYASQPCTPPDDAHSRVLPVVLDPGRTPAVLSEGVNASPGGDDAAVEELLRPACPAQPQLAHEEHESQQNAVGDEGAAHDEMSQTLADVVALAEAQRRDAAKEHLRPGQHRKRLAADAVQDADGRADAP